MADFFQGILPIVPEVAQFVDSHEQVIGITLGDGVAPVISNPFPPPGTPIGRAEAFTFNVTDETSLGRVMVIVKLGANTFVVHDGDSFRSGFAAVDDLTGQPFSSRTVIAGGFAYSVRRPGGWETAPLFEIAAFDGSGNEAPP